METIVVWTYVVGLSLPLLGSAVVLLRSIGSLLVSGTDAGGGPSLMKRRPLPTLLVVLVLVLLVLLALTLVVFFVFKFAMPRYPLPLALDIAGITVFLLYISGSCALFFRITGRFDHSGAHGTTLSGGLVGFVAEKVIGSSDRD